MKDLKSTLNECSKYAKIGYKIASNNGKSLNRALLEAEEKISSTLSKFNSSSCYSPETTALLERQLSETYILICLSSLLLYLEELWRENPH